MVSNVGVGIDCYVKRFFGCYSNLLVRWMFVCGFFVNCVFKCVV